MAAIATYAEANALTIIRTYADEGRSELRIKGWPGLIELIEDVQSGRPTSTTSSSTTSVAGALPAVAQRFGRGARFPGARSPKQAWPKPDSEWKCLSFRPFRIWSMPVASIDAAPSPFPAAAASGVPLAARRDPGGTGCKPCATGGLFDLADVTLANAWQAVGTRWPSRESCLSWRPGANTDHMVVTEIHRCSARLGMRECFSPPAARIRPCDASACNTRRLERPGVGSSPLLSIRRGSPRS
ncbi:recombinase family protein [Bradyrhizobium daqingense]|uniref:hypothetical protein n=1 Tax=Bradyrhizobium daqingense TaxID=993502 RepID=UPI00384E13DB